MVQFVHEVHPVFVVILSTFAHMLCGSNDDTLSSFNLFRVQKIANEVRKVFSTGFNHKPVLQVLCFFQLTSTNQEEAHGSRFSFKRFVSRWIRLVSRWIRLVDAYI